MTNKKINRIVLITFLSVLSFLLMAFIKIPIIPGAEFLILDFSIIPALIVGYFYGIGNGVLLLLLRSILVFILANNGVNTLIGQPINFILSSIFIAIFLLILKKNKNRWLASIVATIGLTISAIIINYFVAVPLYLKFAHFDISQNFGIKRYLVSMVLPFNLIQGILWVLIFFLIFPYILSVFKRLQ